MVKVIVDTNIIFRVFSKGRTRNLILNPSVKLSAPSYLIYEIVDKSDKIISHFNISPEKFHKILKGLYNLVDFVPEFYYKEFIEQAYEIAKNFDPKDTPFIALALKLEIPIWTNDKAMIIHGLKSGKYLAIDTQAVEELVKGKNLEEVKEDLKRRYL